MKITTRLSILCLLMLLLTGCPEEPDITVVPAPSWKAEFTIKNQISQAVPLILKPCHYSHLDKQWYIWSRFQEDETIQDSSKQEEAKALQTKTRTSVALPHPQQEVLKAGEKRTVIFREMFGFSGPEATLSFLAEVGGKTYIGWEKEALVDRQPQPAAPLQPAPVQDRLGYFHLENESATWHGPQAPRTPPPQGSPPTARYTVTITDDGPDGTPQAEFTLEELSY